jgi:hypothetical protein
MTVPNENAYERFRRVHKVGVSCTNKKTSYFIQNHESSTEITVVRTGEELPAVMVMNHAEGADNSLLYVYADADINLGDYFTWKEDYHFFALERVTIIKDVDFKKFTALECNVLVNDQFWAFFAGNKRAFKTTSLMGGFYETDTLQPILIAPINDEFKINGYIRFNNQEWRILSADLDSISGIGYYYIDRALNARDLESEMDNLEENDLAPSASTLYVGQEHTVDTEQGYIVANNIVVVKRTATTATFKPTAAGLLSVTLRRNGNPVSISYEVREV